MFSKISQICAQKDLVFVNQSSKVRALTLLLMLFCAFEIHCEDGRKPMVYVSCSPKSGSLTLWINGHAVKNDIKLVDKRIFTIIP